MKSMLKSWALYLRESYNAVEWTVISVLFSLCLQSVVNSAHCQPAFFFNRGILIGVANIFLYMLYIRIGDDFRDLEADRKYYPERPLASDRVTQRDLSMLKFTTIALLFIINLFGTNAHKEFLITFGLFWLLVNSLFMHDRLSKNRILAFLCYVPVYFVALIIAAYTAGGDEKLVGKENILIAAWLILPGMIYEVARKTRSPKEDTDDYQSYSQLLGYRPALYVLMMFVLIHSMLIFYAFNTWRLAAPVAALLYACSGVFLGLNVLSAVRIPEKNTLIRQGSRLYWVSSFLLTITNSFL